MELAAHMRHAGGFDDLVAIEFLVAPIAVGMHDAAEACEVVSRMRALAVRAVVIGDGCGSGGLIATAVEDVNPDAASFCLTPPGVENIDRGVIRMYSIERGNMRPDSQDEWRQQSGHAADPNQPSRIGRCLSPAGRLFRTGGRGGCDHRTWRS